MSERKVLNKYYPPDFDPDKVPKLRMTRERQYTVRTMAPFNMRCKTCGDYIYQGKKFNAKTENVQDESYLGLRIYRFYIKCPKCISEISFKTDPANEDYALEHGATRLFEAAKMFRKAEEQEKQDREDEEANNPMKILENRTKDSKLEMEILENLEELRELNTRKVDIDYSAILRRKAEADTKMLRKQEEEDEAFVVKLFGKQDGGRIKRLEDDSDDEEGAFSSKEVKRPSDVLTSDDKPQTKKPRFGESSGSKFSSKSALSGLVKVKNSGLKSARPKAMTSSSVSAKTEVNKRQESSASVASELGDKTTTVENTETLSSQPVVTQSDSSESVQNSGCPPTKHEHDQNDHDVNIPDSENERIQLSIQEGLVKREIAQTGPAARPKAKSVGLSLLGWYEVSDDSDGSSE